MSIDLFTYLKLTCTTSWSNSGRWRRRARVDTDSRRAKSRTHALETDCKGSSVRTLYWCGLKSIGKTRVEVEVKRVWNRSSISPNAFGLLMYTLISNTARSVKPPSISTLKIQISGLKRPVSIYPEISMSCVSRYFPIRKR